MKISLVFFPKLPRWISLEHCSYRSRSIGNLRHLSELDLSHCQFNGTLPNSLSNLTKLNHLDFSFNNFTGPLPSFGMAKKLTHLHLFQNGLSGAIPPSSHFEGLQNHLSIDLNNSSIHGAFLRLFYPSVTAGDSTFVQPV
ncbi:putative histone deacetylase [Medicago truncatula]|nr:putative histone deacetylase [Medicago truncatula]